jgi:type IV pilus assembly protein PilM
VFGDFVSELQRSIGYFTSLDRNAKIGNAVALGNPLKLPGLNRYLSDHLGHQMQPVDSFRALTGETVTASPQFTENMLSFCVSYGLCLQGLGQAKLSTNLLPPEIGKERLIREKKPWAVAAVAALLVGCAVNFVGHWSAWRSADVEREDFQTAIREAKSVNQQSQKLKRAYTQAKSNFEQVNAIGANLVSNLEGRLLWLELLKAIDTALPANDPDQRPEQVAEREELHIETLDCEKFEDLSVWYQAVAEDYKTDYRFIYKRDPGAPEPQPGVASSDVTPQSPVRGAGQASVGSTGGAGNGLDAGPTGPGWVVELKGYHYHNMQRDDQGADFVRRTLIRNLHEASVELPDGTVPIQDLGIAYPVIVRHSDIRTEWLSDPNPAGTVSPRLAAARNHTYRPVAMRATHGQTPTGPARQRVDCFDFVVQFCWTKTPPSARREMAKKRAAEAPGASSGSDASGNATVTEASGG